MRKNTSPEHPLCWLCLGANHRADETMPLARRLLTERLPGIRFAEAEQTAPIGTSSPALFTNQVAVLRTPLPPAEVTKILKEVEHACGRRPEHKALGLIPMDIDLLRHADTLLKPDDWARPYVRRGVQRLTPLPDGQ